MAVGVLVWVCGCGCNLMMNNSCGPSDNGDLKGDCREISATDVCI